MNILRRCLIFLLIISAPVLTFGQATVLLSPSSINETSLDVTDLNINLSGPTWIGIDDYDTTFHASNVTLVDEPSGLTVDSLVATSSVLGVVYLSFTPGDFDDTNFTFHLTIDNSILSVGSDAESDTCTLIPNVESLTIDITPNPFPIQEPDINGARIQFDLNNDNTIASLRNDDIDRTHFSLLGVPAGVTIGQIDTDGPGDNLDVFLAYTGTDFDADSSNCRLRINGAALINNAPNPLISPAFELTAVVDLPDANLSPDPIDERTLNGTVLSLTIINDTWKNRLGLLDSHFDLVGEPGDCIISGVSAPDDDHVDLTLQWTGDDFDDTRDFYVRIDGNQLNQFDDASWLHTDTISLNHHNETPQVEMTTGSVLEEFYLGSASLNLQFTEEKFHDYTSLVPTNFWLSDAPPGLTVGSLSNPADSSVTLNLNYIPSDFDSPFTHVRVNIDHSVLVQTESDSLYTPEFRIDENIEPVIDHVDINNEKIGIGDTVDVYIFLSDYENPTYTMTPGATVGGYPLFSFTKMGNDEYWSKFTVGENQTDFDGSVDLPVTGLQINDTPISGETYNGAITGNDNDEIDTRRPILGTLTVITPGAKKINDDVILLISAFNDGYFLEDSSTINGVPATDEDISFARLGGGGYTITYTVKGGDPNVPEGALTAKVHLRDSAGNVSTNDPAIFPNDLSIDASAPAISSVTNTTPNDTSIIGDTVRLTIASDGFGYLLGELTMVNNVSYDKLVLSGTGPSYVLSYGVEEGDKTNYAYDLQALIVLKDSAGNESPPFTSISLNDKYIFTERPTARLTGTDEICVNDTARLYITLTGTSPWSIQYKDENSSYWINNVISDDYTLKIAPDSNMIYQIEQVIDGTGNTNTGQGTSVVVVNPLPDVEIVDLNEVYAIDSNDITLEGSPLFGIFKGPGVVTSENKFNPVVAGLTHGNPHMITYEYTDQNTCFNADTNYVHVVEAQVTYNWPNDPSVACYFNNAYILEAVNLDGVIGQFTVPSENTPGFMTDLGNNSVLFNPSVLQNYEQGANKFEVVYRYQRPGLDTVEVTSSTTLEVEYFDTTIIKGLTETVQCSNQETFLLTGNKTTAVFSGPGTDYIGGLPYFDPGQAGIGINKIYYTYTSENFCVQSDSAEILVNPTPASDFDILDTCIFARPVGDIIRFVNTTDTTGLGELSWEWEFGDIGSGEDNIDTLENPVHWYENPGNWTITLTSTTQNNCVNTFQKPFNFGDKPTADLIWDTECYTDDPIEFNSSTVSADEIATYHWIIKDLSGNEIINTKGGSVLEMLEHDFAERDIYQVELRVETDRECRDNEIDTIYLRPYIQNLTAESSHYEDFEGEAAGWFDDANESSVLESWTYGTVDTEKFPYSSPGGAKSWFTDLARKDTVEQSWVSSPCFDFSDLKRPMVKLDIIVSSDRDRDGAALQYTTNDGATWTNVGAIEDGSINWYNTFRILNGPGGQAEGWTGEFEFNDDPLWQQARHELDDLRGESRVQFRLAYGSDGSSLVDNEGFAFDNFWIGDRSRVVLLEHFNNSGDQASKDANTQINGLVHNNSLDVIDIQYHAEVTGQSDRMNEDNPAPASARALFYGTRLVPFTVFDGGLDGLMTYDYTNSDLDTLDLYTRALRDPGFNIKLDVEVDGGSLSADIEMEALDTLPDQEYILFTAIIEKEISDPAYQGTNGETVFQNVVRVMLPSAAGMSFLRSWNPGDRETASLNWTIDNVLDNEMLYVVAFVQDAGTKAVYQATSNDPDLNATSVAELLATSGMSMLVYPNPAREAAYIMFGEPLGSPVEIQLYNHLGSMVMNDQIQPGIRTYELDINGLSKGVYIIRTMHRGRVMGINKLMIMD